MFATNGMNMEGYGPVATGMGGASYAYDNGTAGLINNPATLALMQSGTSRLDVAVGGLHPDVTTKMTGSRTRIPVATAYYMPAIGYVRKDGKFSYGAGMMAQGGMGTEYGSVLAAEQLPVGRLSALGGAWRYQGASGAANRSELGIGRVMVPLAFDISDNFRIGGTLDYLWGGLDLQMVMRGAMFAAIHRVWYGVPESALGNATGSMVTPWAVWTGGCELGAIRFFRRHQWHEAAPDDNGLGRQHRLRLESDAATVGRRCLPRQDSPVATWKATAPST